MKRDETNLSSSVVKHLTKTMAEFQEICVGTWYNKPFLFINNWETCITNKQKTFQKKKCHMKVLKGCNFIGKILKTNVNCLWKYNLSQHKHEFILVHLIFFLRKEEIWVFWCSSRKFVEEVEVLHCSSCCLSMSRIFFKYTSYKWLLVLKKWYVQHVENKSIYIYLFHYIWLVFVIFTYGQQNVIIIILIKRRMWIFFGVKLSTNMWILEHNIKMVFIHMYAHSGNNPWFWSPQLYMLPPEEMLNLMMGSWIWK